MKEADKKVWIVPGKIRVASVFFALIVAAVVTTSVVMGDVQRKERAVQEHLAEEVLRFHVLANSDSRKDQAVKLEVRDAVLSYLKEVLPEGMDVKETTRWMREHTEEIRRVAEQKMTDLQMLPETYSPRDYEKPILDIEPLLETLQTDIKLRIHKSVLDRVLEYCTQDRVIPDGEEYYLVNYPFIERDYYYDMLLSFGDKCECLEPARVREEIKRRIQSMASVYRDRT